MENDQLSSSRVSRCTFRYSALQLPTHELVPDEGYPLLHHFAAHSIDATCRTDERIRPDRPPESGGAGTWSGRMVQRRTASSPSPFRAPQKKTEGGGLEEEKEMKTKERE
jgi:hypothetical protein